MKISKFRKIIKNDNFFIAVILLLSLFLRLAFFFQDHNIWWDSAVYIGAGKYIYSLGEIGLWEPIRPVVWPIILGFVWKLNLDPLVFGRIIELTVSLGVVYLTYEITKKMFSRNAAILASVFVSFSPVFFFMGFRLYNEIIATFFLLLGIHFLLNKNFKFAGVFIAVSSLTKYTHGMFIIIIGAYVLYVSLKEKRLKDFAGLTLGAGAVIILFFISNTIFYGSPIYPLAEANTVIQGVLGCNVLAQKEWYFYFQEILNQNIFHVFLLAGLFALPKSIEKIKAIDPKKILILILFFTPLLYFTALNCKVSRYLIIFLPFLCMLSADQISRIIQRVRIKHHFNIIATLVILFSAVLAVSFYMGNETPHSRPLSYDFYEVGVEGKEIWVASPWHAIYLDRKLNLIYYPVYSQKIAEEFNEILLKKEKPMTIYIDYCGGGIFCAENDIQCNKERESMLEILIQDYSVEYNLVQDDCEYFIFSSE